MNSLRKSLKFARIPKPSRQRSRSPLRDVDERVYHDDMSVPSSVSHDESFQYEGNKEAKKGGMLGKLRQSVRVGLRRNKGKSTGSRSSSDDDSSLPSKSGNEKKKSKRGKTKENTEDYRSVDLDSMDSNQEVEDFLKDLDDQYQATGGELVLEAEEDDRRKSRKKKKKTLSLEDLMDQDPNDVGVKKKKKKKARQASSGDGSEQHQMDYSPSAPGVVLGPDGKKLKKKKMPRQTEVFDDEYGDVGQSPLGPDGKKKKKKPRQSQVPDDEYGDLSERVVRKKKKKPRQSQAFHDEYGGVEQAPTERVVRKKKKPRQRGVSDDESGDTEQAPDERIVKKKKKPRQPGVRDDESGDTEQAPDERIVKKKKKPRQPGVRDDESGDTEQAPDERVVKKKKKPRQSGVSDDAHGGAEQVPTERVVKKKKKPRQPEVHDDEYGDAEQAPGERVVMKKKKKKINETSSLDAQESTSGTLGERQRSGEDVRPRTQKKKKRASEIVTGAADENLDGSPKGTKKEKPKLKKKTSKRTLLDELDDFESKLGGIVEDEPKKSEDPEKESNEAQVPQESVGKDETGKQNQLDPLAEENQGQGTASAGEGEKDSLAGDGGDEPKQEEASYDMDLDMYEYETDTEEEDGPVPEAGHNDHEHGDMVFENKLNDDDSFESWESDKSEKDEVAGDTTAATIDGPPVEDKSIPAKAQNENDQSSVESDFEVKSDDTSEEKEKEQITEEKSPAVVVSEPERASPVHENDESSSGSEWNEDDDMEKPIEPANSPHDQDKPSESDKLKSDTPEKNQKDVDESMEGETSESAEVQLGNDQSFAEVEKGEIDTSEAAEKTTEAISETREGETNGPTEAECFVESKNDDPSKRTQEKTTDLAETAEGESNEPTEAQLGNDRSSIESENTKVDESRKAEKLTGDVGEITHEEIPKQQETSPSAEETPVLVDEEADKGHQISDEVGTDVVGTISSDSNEEQEEVQASTKPGLSDDSGDLESDIQRNELSSQIDNSDDLIEKKEDPGKDMFGVSALEASSRVNDGGVETKDEKETHEEEGMPETTSDDGIESDDKDSEDKIGDGDEEANGRASGVAGDDNPDAEVIKAIQKSSIVSNFKNVFENQDASKQADTDEVCPEVADEKPDNENDPGINSVRKMSKVSSVKHLFERNDSSASDSSDLDIRAIEEGANEQVVDGVESKSVGETEAADKILEETDESASNVKEDDPKAESDEDSVEVNEQVVDGVEGGDQSKSVGEPPATEDKTLEETDESASNVKEDDPKAESDEDSEEVNEQVVDGVEGGDESESAGEPPATADKTLEEGQVSQSDETPNSEAPSDESKSEDSASEEEAQDGPNKPMEETEPQDETAVSMKSLEAEDEQQTPTQKLRGAVSTVMAANWFKSGAKAQDAEVSPKQHPDDETGLEVQGFSLAYEDANDAESATSSVSASNEAGDEVKMPSQSNIDGTEIDRPAGRLLSSFRGLSERLLSPAEPLKTPSGRKNRSLSERLISSDSYRSLSDRRNRSLSERLISPDSFRSLSDRKLDLEIEKQKKMMLMVEKLGVDPEWNAEMQEKLVRQHQEEKIMLADEISMIIESIEKDEAAVAETEVIMDSSSADGSSSAEQTPAVDSDIFETPKEVSKDFGSPTVRTDEFLEIPDSEKEVSTPTNRAEESQTDSQNTNSQENSDREQQLETMANDLQKQVEELKDELDKQQAKTARLEEEAANYDTKMAEQEDQIATYKGMYEDLQEDYDVVLLKYNEHVGQNASLLGMLETMKRTATEQDTALTAKNNYIQMLEKAVQALQASNNTKLIENLKDENAKLRSIVKIQKESIQEALSGLESNPQ